MTAPNVTDGPAPAPKRLAASQPRELISQRLRQARRNVQVVDLATAMATLVAATLFYLLVLILCDHWLFNLSPTMRMTALITWCVAATSYVVLRIVPPLVRPVNPVYAARMIEQAAPSMKNSLINLLLISGRRGQIRQVIYDGLRRQAAGRLSQVAPEALVDRAPLIRMGYWLVALLALAALYKVLSPKDPLRTVARVVMPLSQIDRPARVTISEIQPGDVECFRGQSVEVTARVVGLDSDDRPQLLISSPDGQYQDFVVTMEAVGGQRYRGMLSTGSEGIQSSLTYRLRGGDAESRTFQVTTSEAPYMTLERVVLDYPQYTGLADRELTNQGDLLAIEGTRARIEAKANQEIANASIELFATPNFAQAPTRSLSMKHRGQSARVELTLRLESDRRTPQYAGYQLRFANPEGYRNQRPVHYRIEVEPDLPPDVALLSPSSQDTTLAADQAMTIEARAFDPDFAVQQLRIVGVTGTSERFRQSLLDSSQSGQVVRRWQLVPAEHGLKAGDLLVIWAEADDNRHAPNGRPEPNQTRTDNYRIRIVASQNDQGSDGPEGSDPSADAPEGGDTGDGPSTGSPDGQGENSDTTEGPSDTQAEQGTEASDTAKPDGPTNAADAQDGNDGEASEGADDDPSASNDSDASGGPGNGEGTDAGQESGDTDSSSEPSPNDGGPNGNSTGGTPEEGDSPENQEPIPSDGSNDSDAFERILKHMQEAGDGSQAESQGDPSEPSSDAGRGDSDGSEPSDSAAGSSAESSRSQGGDRVATDDPAEADGQGAESDASASPDSADPGANSSDSSEMPRPSGDPDAERNSEGVADGTDRPEREGERTESSRSNGEPSVEDPSANAQDRSSQGSAADDPQQSNANADESIGDRGSAAESTPDDGGQGASDDRSPAASDNPVDNSDSDSQSSDGGTEGDVEPQSSRGSDGSEPDGRPGDSPPELPNGQDENNASSSSDAGDGAGGTDSSTPADGSDASSSSTSSTNSPDGDPTGLPSGGRPGPAQDHADSSAAQTAEPPNLEYARRATDMALDYLKDHPQDPELLEKLGWTPEEMRAFRQRWEQMRNSAPDTDTDAAERFVDQLQGLGLRPPSSTLRRSAVQPDSGGRLRQSGSQVPIPDEYREQYRAFLKSLSVGSETAESR